MKKNVEVANTQLPPQKYFAAHLGALKPKHKNAWFQFPPCLVSVFDNVKVRSRPAMYIVHWQHH